MSNRIFLMAMILVSWSWTNCKVAKPSFSRSFPDRYSLDIPEKWRKNVKLIDAITEVMPQLVNQLEEKDFCIDCAAAYTVRFEMSEITHAASGGYFDVYQFKAALTVYDSTEKGISRLVLVDPDKDDVIFYHGSIGGDSAVISSRRLSLASSTVNATASGDFQRYSFFEKVSYPSKIKPVIYRDILKYVEKRIIQTRDTLAGLPAEEK